MEKIDIIMHVSISEKTCQKNSYYHIYLNYVCIMLSEKNFFLCVPFEGINILWTAIYDIIKYLSNFIL